jgi:hypothetical protein
MKLIKKYPMLKKNTKILSNQIKNRNVNFRNRCKLKCKVFKIF